MKKTTTTKKTLNSATKGKEIISTKTTPSSSVKSTSAHNLSSRDNVKSLHPTHIDENMYICMTDITLKRKHLLGSLKSSLILQEEQERIAQIRSDKVHLLMEIKKEMESINVKYQSLKKLLPNVKNVISYTEKELTDLDLQIDFLKKDVKNKNKEIELDQRTIESLNSGNRLSKTKKFEEIKVESNVKEKMILDSKKKNMTKIERIQNNLKVIESKLKGI